MSEDIYVNVCGEYDYSWNESSLYEFLARSYMFNGLEFQLNDGSIIKVEKYNVCGSTKGNKKLKIYETNGNTETPIHTIPFHEITTIKKITK